MAVCTCREHIKTRGDAEVVDITALATKALRKSGLRDGLLTVFVPGSTAAVTTIEFESGAVQDLRAAIERLVPESAHYEHDKRWGDGNGQSCPRGIVETRPGYPVRRNRAAARHMAAARSHRFRQSPPYPRDRHPSPGGVVQERKSECS